MWPQQTPHLLLHSFHLSSEIALYSPPSLVLGHFSECYIGIIFSCLNFVVFLKFKFYDKKFSSWLLASHRIIIPVWMLNIFLIHFFLYLDIFSLLSTIVDFRFPPSPRDFRECYSPKLCFWLLACLQIIFPAWIMRIVFIYFVLS